MKHFKTTILGTIIGITAIIGCNNSNTESKSDSIIESRQAVTTKEINQPDVDKIIDDYAKSLGTDKIKFIDSVACEQNEKNKIDYEKGILNYQYISINHNSEKGKIIGDFNGDDLPDYIANYSCDNCWGGIGAGNFLSNCFFLTTQNGEVKVEETITNNFKQKLIEVLTKDFGNTYYKNAEKEIMINGLEFTEIKNQTAFGKFNINTEKCESAQPCYEGTFEYDVKNNLLKMTGKNTEK